MAGNDLKQTLRKLDFPYCAREALCRIEILYCRPGKQVDLQMDVISEFIFGELEKRKKRNISIAIQELQLIEVLCDFFQNSSGSPAARNALFLSLFPADSSRYNTLGKLVSLAIAMQNIAILNAAGIWMQQLGSTSSQSVGLARHLLNDYFVLTPRSTHKLKQLPELVPHFTANLLTAIGEIYEDKDPPNELLQLVGEWIEGNRNLLLTSLMDNPPLPSGGIPMTPITPIAGLFRWCILSPLRNDVMESTGDQADSRKFYSKIQQLLMDSVLHLKNNSNKHAISAQHLAATTRLLTTRFQNQSNVSKASYDLALERLAQAINAAISANCIYGNKQELLMLLQPLAYQNFLIEWTLQSYASKAT